LLSCGAQGLRQPLPYLSRWSQYRSRAGPFRGERGRVAHKTVKHIVGVGDVPCDHALQVDAVSDGAQSVTRTRSGPVDLRDIPVRLAHEAVNSVARIRVVSDDRALQVEGR
jgi:hypothetical protein